MNSRTTKPIFQSEKSTRFIPERLGTPEDVYDDPEQGGSLPSIPSPEIPSTTTDEIKFDIPPNPSPKYLFNLATRLQTRHTFLHSILKQATITAQEAAASVFIMQARLDGERKKMRRMMDTLADLVGNWKEQESDDDDDGAQGDEGEEERREDSLSEHHAGEGEMGPDRSNVAPPGENSSASMPDLESNGPNLDKGKEKETNTIQALPVVPPPIQFHSSPGRGSGFTIAFGSKSKTTPNFSVALDLSRKRSRAEHDEEVAEGSGKSTGKQRSTSVQGHSSRKRPRLEHPISNENQFIQGSSTGPGHSRYDALYDAYQNSKKTTTNSSSRSGVPLKRTYSVHNFDDCGEDPWSAENGSTTQVSAYSSPPPPSSPLQFPKSYTLPNMFNFLWGPNSAKASAKARELVGMPNRVVKRNLRAPLAGRARIPTQALRRAPSQRQNGIGAVQSTLRRTPSMINVTVAPEDFNPGQKEKMVGRSMTRTRPREEEEEAQERPSKRSRGHSV